MTALLDALGPASPSASDTTSAGCSSAASSPRSVRDLPSRLLRCIDTVEISGTALNWDAKQCFVVLVAMRDSDARRKAYASGGGSARSGTAPFQIERTRAEFHKLHTAIQQCCAKAHATADSEKPCTFCAPVVSGAVVEDAMRVAHDTQDTTEVTPSGCFSFLGTSSSAKSRTLRSGDEWAAWLNACVAHVRHYARVDEMAEAEICEGRRHVPELLAQCLLEGFTTVTSP